MLKKITTIANRVALISETLNNNEEMHSSLIGAGMSEAFLEEGREALLGFLEMVEELTEHVADHTALERAERNIVELEAWLDTHVRLWRRAAGAAIDDAQWDAALGVELVGADPMFRVTMRAWRLLSVMRTHVELQEALAGRAQLSDELMRGRSLLHRGLRQMRLLSKLKAGEERDGASYEEMVKVGSEMESWLARFDEQVLQASDDIEDLGLLGVAPEGQALPLGGASHTVVLHRKGQRTPPEPVPAASTPHWSVGASGNKENYWKS